MSHCDVHYAPSFNVPSFDSLPRPASIPRNCKPQSHTCTCWVIDTKVEWKHWQEAQIASPWLNQSKHFRVGRKIGHIQYKPREGHLHKPQCKTSLSSPCTAQPHKPSHALTCYFRNPRNFQDISVSPRQNQSTILPHKQSQHLQLPINLETKHRVRSTSSNLLLSYNCVYSDHQIAKP